MRGNTKELGTLWIFLGLLAASSFMLTFSISAGRVIGGALVAWAIHIVLLVYRRRKFFRNLPGPPHSWILGHLGAMGIISKKFPPNCHPQLLFTEMTREWDLPAVWYIDLWPAADPMVIITEVEDMNHIQVFKPLPQHPSSDDFMAPMIGRNVVATANGPTWKMLRNAMNPSFASGHIKHLSKVIVEEVTTFRATLQKLAKEGKPFDLETKGAEVIFDVIARIVYNFPLEAQRKGSQTLSDLRELVHLVEQSFSLNPLNKLKVWMRRDKLSKRLDASIRKVVADRYQVLKHEGVVPNRKDPYSTLDLMLREQLMQGKELKEIDREFDQLLITNIKGLLLGGHGTTNDTLCYCYMLLSKHPEAMTKLRAEHDAVFSPSFSTTMKILKENPYKLNELTYTTAVVRETLRLFPVGFGPKKAADDAVLNSVDGNQYPIGNNLVVVPLWHHMHYSPKYFPNPTLFDPERFVDPEVVARGTMRTFSRGPRGCAGQELAIDELRIILLMTAREFDFEYAYMEPNKVARTRYTDLDTVFGDVIFQELGLEAKPRGGMIMKIRERLV